MNFFRPVAESPAIALLILNEVFAPHTKNLSAYDTDNGAAAATIVTEFIWGAARGSGPNFATFSNPIYFCFFCAIIVHLGD